MPSTGSVMNSRRMDLLLGAILLASLLGGLLVLPRISPNPGTTGAMAKDFSLPIVAGGDQNDRISLAALRDKTVVLDFWATWCGPCTEQSRILESFVATPRPDVTVLGINQGEPSSVLAAHFGRHPAAYPILSDADESVGRAYGIRGLPTLVIVDRGGRIHAVLSGVVPQARLERLVAEAAAAR